MQQYFELSSMNPDMFQHLADFLHLHEHHPCQVLFSFDSELLPFFLFFQNNLEYLIHPQNALGFLPGSRSAFQPLFEDFQAWFTESNGLVPWCFVARVRGRKVFGGVVFSEHFFLWINLGIPDGEVWRNVHGEKFLILFFLTSPSDPEGPSLVPLGFCGSLWAVEGKATSKLNPGLPLLLGCSPCFPFSAPMSLCPECALFIFQKDH